MTSKPSTLLSVSLMPEDEIRRLTLPPGRHRLPREYIQHHQRRRLFSAIVELVDEHGYPSTSLTQVVKRAGIARHTFYEHFEDKEALFLAVLDETGERALSVAQEAARAERGPWEGQVRSAMAAVLAGIAEEPALARICLTEYLTASLTALDHYEAVMGRFAALLRTGRAGAARGATLPDSLEDVLVGGIVWKLNRRLSSDPDSVEALLPDILEFLLMPYVGETVAHEVAYASE